jgi:hypothetical protein
MFRLNDQSQSNDDEHNTSALHNEKDHFTDAEDETINTVDKQPDVLEDLQVNLMDNDEQETENEELFCL